MPIPVVCSSCRQKASLPDHLAGCNMKCPECGGFFVSVIPQNNAAIAQSDFPVSPPPQPDRPMIRFACPTCEAPFSVDPKCGRPGLEVVRSTYGTWQRRQAVPEPARRLCRSRRPQWPSRHRSAQNQGRAFGACATTPSLLRRQVARLLDGIHQPARRGAGRQHAVSCARPGPVSLRLPGVADDSHATRSPADRAHGHARTHQGPGAEVRHERVACQSVTR
jgi:hypothetical protein